MNKKLYLVTTQDGKTNYVASLTDIEKSELLSRGASVEDPATGSDNDSGIVSEDLEKNTITKNDLINLVKTVDTSVKEALHRNEDAVAFTQQFFNKASKTISIEVTFKRDKDSVGEPSKRRFEFKLTNKKITLKVGQDYVDMAQLIQQSGIVTFNKDVAIDVIYNYLQKSNETSGHAGEVQNSPEASEEIKGNLDEFKTAVRKYKTNRSRDSLKELVMASRSFPGDDIQHKLQAAIQAYQGKGCTPSCCTPEDSSNVEEAICESDLKLDVSLFIRLLEYAREDSKKDVDLHFVAENLDKICKEKGCASMDDYDTIISKSSQPKQSNDQPNDTDETQEDLEESRQRYEYDPGYIVFDKLEVAYEVATRDCTVIDRKHDWPDVPGTVVVLEAVVDDYDIEEDYLDENHKEVFFIPKSTYLTVTGGYERDGVGLTAKEAEQLLSQKDYEIIEDYVLDEFEYIGG